MISFNTTYVIATVTSGKSTIHNYESENLQWNTHDT